MREVLGLDAAQSDEDDHSEDSEGQDLDDQLHGVFLFCGGGRGELPGRPRNLVTTELLVKLLVLRSSTRGRHQEPSDRADSDGNEAAVGDDEARSVDGPPGPDKEQDREDHHHSAQHELQASHHQRHRVAGNAVCHIAGHWNTSLL